MTHLIGQHRGGRVVVGVDGLEASKDALHWAVREAELTGSSVEAVMAWEVPTAAYGFGMPMPTEYDLAAYAGQVLREVVREVVGERPAVQVSAVVREGHPGKVLVATAEDADLLVVGNRVHGAVVGILLGSVGEYCASHATCPVVVVRHGRYAPAGKARAVASSAPCK